jgi:hypothetical protein
LCKGGWGFFAFQGDAPASQIPYTAACYACHEAHGAADLVCAASKGLGKACAMALALEGVNVTKCHLVCR